MVSTQPESFKKTRKLFINLKSRGNQEFSKDVVFHSLQFGTVIVMFVCLSLVSVVDGSIPIIMKVYLGAIQKLRNCFFRGEGVKSYIT